MNNTTIPGGYVILSRTIIESEIWDKPPLYIKVWIYLITKAQHTNYKKLKRGQLWTSIPEIQEACSWYVGFRKETPSKDKIYKVLNWLRNSSESNIECSAETPMITTTKATRGLLITIESYDLYQTPKNYEKKSDQSNESYKKNVREQQKDNMKNKNGKNEDNKKKYPPDSVEYQMALKLLNQIRNNNPNFKDPNIDKWANEVRLMIEVDKRDPYMIEKVIEWCQNHSFWKSTIISTRKLRAQFDQLLMKMNTENDSKEITQHSIPSERPSYLKPPNITSEDKEALYKKRKEVPY